ncbi:MAG: beta-ketoacyl-[acyl-carrier-protein] synthase family protein [Planctomycetes bacterium]|nr:beta-ketoacyl-[acyl-carrier-protein] synthase family protein [Planctomycetota bacterium]
MRRRVVITGMGAITPLGHSVQSMFEAQLAGKSGVAPIRRFNATAFPTSFAAEVKDFELARFVSGAERWANSGVNSQFAAAAAQQALADAGVLEDGRVDRTRFGIYLGSGEGIQDFPNLIALIAQAWRREGRKFDAATFTRNALQSFHAGHESEQELHTTAGHLGAHFGLEGPNYNCLTACAASAQATGEAMEMIRHGDVDLMLAGGSHSMIHPLGVTGFNRLTALSTRNDAPQKASRPFDLHRDGFVLGEGAGMLVLEEYEHARRRGATIYAELTGYGSTADAFRVTDSHPDGRGAIACVEAALKDSGLPRDQIGYINAHGTSTKVNDLVETIAIKKVFGEGAYQVPISSSKSMLGHLIAAAGAVELITCVMALRRGVLPPTINYETPDPECDLDYIPNQAREKRIRHALSNSFGFGGQNISLIVSLL